MIVKVKDKEYSFDGYVNPIDVVQKLAEECYEQGIADKKLYFQQGYNQGRRDAIKEVISYLHKYDIIDCNCCTENNRCDRDCWDVIAEQLKKEKNDA